MACHRANSLNVVRFNPRTKQRSLDELAWGLLPHDTVDLISAPRPTHARAETLIEKPMFADAFARRRAIVPIDEFSQRASLGDDEGRRFRVSRSDGQTMAFAGLWESFVRPEGQIVRTFCIITVVSGAPLAQIHDRSPVVVEPEAWPLWLGEVPGDASSLPRAPGPGVLRLVQVGAKGRKRAHV